MHYKAQINLGKCLKIFEIRRLKKITHQLLVWSYIVRTAQNCTSQDFLKTFVVNFLYKEPKVYKNFYGV